MTIKSIPGEEEIKQVLLQIEPGIDWENIVGKTVVFSGIKKGETKLRKVIAQTVDGIIIDQIGPGEYRIIILIKKVGIVDKIWYFTSEKTWNIFDHSGQIKII